MKNDLKTKVLKGKILAGGISLGRVCLYKEDIMNASPRFRIPVEGVEDEKQRLLRAIDSTKGDLRKAYDSVAKKLSAMEAEVFNAHIMILEDFSFINKIEERIAKERINSEAALLDVVKEYEMKFNALESEYFRERVSDINDITRRLLNSLEVRHSGFMCAACHEEGPSIVAAKDLTPTLISDLGKKRPVGIVIEKGSMFSHGAVLARAMGISVLIGVAGLIDNLNCGVEVLIDGDNGELHINPGKDIINKYKAEINRETGLCRKYSAGYARTKDKVEIYLHANAGSVKVLPIIKECKIKNIGLFRTEFVFINRHEEPGVDEQVNIYREAIDSVEGIVNFRLLDIGGDKLLDFLSIPAQENPSLGLRGVRIYDQYPDIIANQIKALLIAKGRKPVKIMIPMVSTVEEFIQTRDKILDIMKKLKKKHEIDPENLKIGSMIEVPSAVYTIRHFAEVSDFLSIGTNDLIQYVMGVDRANTSLSDLADPFQPAVIKALSDIVNNTKEAGKEVTICGEIAGDPELARILVGLGFRYLSISPYSFDRIGDAIGSYKLGELEEEVESILKANTLEDIKGIVASRSGNKIN